MDDENNLNNSIFRPDWQKKIRGWWKNAFRLWQAVSFFIHPPLSSCLHHILLHLSRVYNANGALESN